MDTLIAAIAVCMILAGLSCRSIVADRAARRRGSLAESRQRNAPPPLSAKAGR